jgi:hypothetical protein
MTRQIAGAISQKKRPLIISSELVTPKGNYGFDPHLQCASKGTQRLIAPFDYDRHPAWTGCCEGDAERQLTETNKSIVFYSSSPIDALDNRRGLAKEMSSTTDRIGS